MISDGVDTNFDGEISYAEAAAKVYLYIFENSITDLTGIDAFINLDTLDITNTQATGLDVSTYTLLSKLYCAGNQLNSLDVSGCAALTNLSCCCNQLDSLDISNNTSLSYLECHNNELTSLKISNNVALLYLDCGSNWLSSLDVSACTALTELHCVNNDLTTLDVSSNTELKELSLSSMPTLHKVCVWLMPFPPVGVNVYTTGSPNIYFTTDCADNIADEYSEVRTTNIYPNPASDKINIEIGDIKNAIIEIYNLSGTLIFSKAFNSKLETIDISGFPKGIYLVKVIQESMVNFVKLVVK